MTSEPSLSGRPCPDAAVRLVCFPHAGGGPSVFASWTRRLGPEVEVRPAALPGRETMSHSPALESVHQIATRLSHAILDAPHKPLVLLGHSLGALVAYEVARILEGHGAPLRRLIASGRGAPDRPSGEPALSDLADNALLTAVRETWGALPTHASAPGPLRAQVLPTLRADLRAADRYLHVPGPPLRADIITCAGAADPYVTEAHLDAWDQRTGGAFSRTVLEGDHFYLFDDHSDFITHLRRWLGPALGPPASVAPSSSTRAPAAVQLG